MKWVTRARPKLPQERWDDTSMNVARGVALGRGTTLSPEMAPSLRAWRGSR